MVASLAFAGMILVTSASVFGAYALVSTKASKTVSGWRAILLRQPARNDQSRDSRSC